MQIFENIQNLINTYTQNNTKNAIDTIKPLLKNAQIGEELKVELLSIMKEYANVMLEDGSEMTLAGQMPKDATVGKILTILIQDRLPDGLVKAKILNVETPEMSNIEAIKKSFNELGLKLDDENMKIAKQMLLEHIDINTDNVSLIVNAYKEAKELKIKDVMFMIKNDIEITAENVDAFKNMMRKENYILNDLESMYDYYSTGSKVAKNVNGTSMLSNKIENFESSTETYKTHQSSQSNINESDESALEIEANLNEVALKTVYKAEHNELLKDEGKNTLENLSTDKSMENLNKVAQNTSSDAKLDMQEGLEFFTQLNEDITNKETFANSEVLKSELTTPKDAAGELPIRNQKLEVAKEKFINLNDKDFSEKEEIDSIRQQIARVFKHVDSNKQLNKEINTKNIAKEMSKIMKQIDEYSKEHDNAELEIKASKFKQDLKLYNSINKYNNYFQIPLDINNSKTMAELYVFNGERENSNKKINEKNYTMFFTLNTANIGEVDAYIKVVNKTVECAFMTANEEVASIIEKEQYELINLLDAYGYKLIKLSSKAEVKELNVVSTIEENKIKNEKMKFDMKV